MKSVSRPRVPVFLFWGGREFSFFLCPDASYAAPGCKHKAGTKDVEHHYAGMVFPDFPGGERTVCVSVEGGDEIKQMVSRFLVRRELAARFLAIVLSS